MKYTLFVSDVHLSANAPERTQRFLTFLQTEAPAADAVYILGDLFDLWVGDDERTELSKQIKAALLKLRIPHYFISGNHDFLLTSGFARATDLQLLPDPFCLTLYGKNLLLSHGDLLCTQDEAYQKYRKLTRNIFLQILFLWLPWRWRLALAKKLQKKSDQENAKKTHEIMDVNQEAVKAWFETYDCDVLIHGHTHRPAIHSLSDQQTRIVMGSWEDQGEYIKFTEDGKFLLCAASR